MDQYDRLPPELRRWLASAALPWSARSALRLWTRAMTQTGCPQRASAYLHAVEAKTLARDRLRVAG